MTDQRPCVNGSSAWLTVLATAVAGVGGLGAHWIPALRIRQLWWFVVVAELTIFVQVALGVYMVASGQQKAPQFHMFYGFVAIITVAILYSYRNSLRAWQYVLYGGGSLFLMGLGSRALIVGLR